MSSLVCHTHTLVAVRGNTHGRGLALTHVLCCVVTGAGIDGVEEIKRHPFFVTIDWNVS